MSEGKEKEEVKVAEKPHVHGPHCRHGHHHEPMEPVVRQGPKISRNDPCVCGSNKKFKKCCGASL